jgi:hypothetical protein
VATCFSLFKVLFEKGYPFSYDLTELARYYIGYSHLMEHWRETLPGRIVEVSHEDLVSRSAQSQLQLLEQLGLPRELDPRPVPARAAAIWKRYEAQLQPLITLLGRRDFGTIDSQLGSVLEGARHAGPWTGGVRGVASLSSCRWRTCIMSIRRPEGGCSSRLGHRFLLYRTGQFSGKIP